MKSLPSLAPALLCAGLLAGCAGMSPSGPTATATLAPTTGNSTTGQVRFVQSGPKVLVSGEVRGLKPNSVHGFHIHEKGDCSSGDGMSAGGHFNPTGSAHGQFGTSPSHAGDLWSLQSDANGVATFSYESGAITVGSGNANDVVGRGLVVHRDPDDFTSQPAGNSGPRLACAVITRG